MKKRYIFAILFSIVGLIIGYLIGWLLFFGIIYLFKVINIEDFQWSGSWSWIGVIFGFSPLVIFYASPIIGLIRGWRYGYKMGIKKEENANKP